MSVLECRGIEKSFRGEIVLKGVTLALEEGEITGIIGKNGAGKSTLFKVLAGLLVPDRGDIYFLGNRMMSGIGECKETMFLFDDQVFLDSFNPAENTRAFAKLHADRAALASNIGLFDDGLMRLKKEVRRFSHGMRQRFALSMLLELNNYKLMILDEPTNGLDYKTLLEFEDFLKKSKEDGISILLSSHYIEFLCRSCDRITVIEGGEISEELSKADIGIEALRSFLA